MNNIVDEILGDQHGVTGIRIKDVSDEFNQSYRSAWSVHSIGHKPNTEIFVNQLEMDQGYIKTSLAYGAATATNIPGVFAAGDVESKLSSSSIAAGFGCMAAIDAKNFLAKL